MKKKTIILQLLTVDFENPNYGSNCDCPVGKACARQLGLNRDDIIECVDWVYLGYDLDRYDHEVYGLDKFNADVKLAEQKEPNTVIRTLTLTKA